METRANHVLIGAFTVVAFLAAALFVMWIGKLSADREHQDYLVIFEEAVTGLSNGGQVQYNGIQVGEVTRLSLDPDSPGRVIARVRLAAATPVRKDTVAKLGFLGLTGVAFIQLSGGSEGMGPPALEREGLPVIRSEVSDLQRLLTGSEDIVTSVNDVLFRLSTLFSQENMSSIGQTLSHVERIASTISENSEDIGRAINETAEASARLRETLDVVDGLILNLDRFANTTTDLLDSETRALINDTRESVTAVRELVENTNQLLVDNSAAIDSFSQQGLAQANASLLELRELLRSLSQVSRQLENDPGGFLLGRDKPREFTP